LKLRDGWHRVTKTAPAVGVLVLGYNAHGYALYRRAIYNLGEDVQSVEWEDAHGSYHDGDTPLIFCIVPETPYTPG
jgi:hypothetical protein